MLSWREKSVLHSGEEPCFSPGWGLSKGVKCMPSKLESAGAGRAASKDVLKIPAFLSILNTPHPTPNLQFKGPFE